MRLTGWRVPRTFRREGRDCNRLVQILAERATFPLSTGERAGVRAGVTTDVPHAHAFFMRKSAQVRISPPGSASVRLFGGGGRACKFGVRSGGGSGGMEEMESWSGGEMGNGRGWEGCGIRDAGCGILGKTAYRRVAPLMTAYLKKSHAATETPSSHPSPPVGEKVPGGRMRGCSRPADKSHNDCNSV